MQEKLYTIYTGVEEKKYWATSLQSAQRFASRQRELGYRLILLDETGQWRYCREPFIAADGTPGHKPWREL